jgi:hypothetical protein
VHVCVVGGRRGGKGRVRTEREGRRSCKAPETIIKEFEH